MYITLENEDEYGSDETEALLDLQKEVHIC